MKIRTRFFIAFMAMAVAAVYVLLSWVGDDLRPRYQAAMEESMVDTATVLATVVERESAEGALQGDLLREVFSAARRKRFEARIYEFTKTSINLRVYVMDRQGTVLFDSHDGAAEGRDFSRWNDVARTLRGQYGARATRMDPDDPMTAILHVAAPIRLNGEIAGVLTVAKPAESVELFIETARREIVRAGIAVAAAIFALAAAVSFWITRPIQQLTAYAKAVGDGARVPAPKLGHSEIGALARAFEEMRRALEGKEYVENYVQTLTHQMKGPLSGIRGAAELLEEELPEEQRNKFLQNLRTETGRLQDFIDRMLLLAGIENRKELTTLEALEVDELVREALSHQEAAIREKELSVALQMEPVRIRGEGFLLVQALCNVLQNAVEFSPRGGRVGVSVKADGMRAEIRVADAGPGIPEYALDRVFERFYSLTRPETGHKSSGLGLSIVREVVGLHGGSVRVGNSAEGGAVAVISLPMMD